ncbi:type II toxin-antitoxin system HicB family antitoxin [Candidatus Micrarchaeota archaeon]|nr:type II toxin-antitoxin system HicB family antitoxin [Candidatus Micrarchaeota archaeon]MBU2476592.1 type II toxin-antitoxin system HicB family antitoxin [Candidatus Micrarchaeota archaeon]
MEKKFKIVVEKGLDGYFIGEVPELPGCYSQGKTVKELMKNIKEAIEVYLETVNDLNKKPEKRFFRIKEVVVNA